MNEYIVSAEQEGMRLDVFLTEQMKVLVAIFKV